VQDTSIIERSLGKRRTESYRAALLLVPASFFTSNERS
jgi:hypothetical protein